MKPFIRVCWLGPPRAEGSEGSAPDAEIIQEYVSAIERSGAPSGSAAFTLVKGGEITEAIRARRRAGKTMGIVGRDIYKVMPNCLILTEFDSLDAATVVETQLSERNAELDAKFAADAPERVASGIYYELSFTSGTQHDLAPESGFASVVQLGTFNMPSGEDELAMQEWYRTRRLPSFSKIKGGIRARRIVSVCGGPAKLGVLYEFASLADRIEHFEPLEAVDHDDDRPTAAGRTQHPPFSASIGTALLLT